MRVQRTLTAAAPATLTHNVPPVAASQVQPSMAASRSAGVSIWGRSPSAVVTALGMPLTFSISNGIALGFIAYGAIKLLSGRVREVGWPMAILAVLFILHYWVG